MVITFKYLKHIVSVMTSESTTRVSRLSITFEDRAKLRQLLNVGNLPNISFVIIAHRCVEALEAFIKEDTTGIMERLTQTWSMEEANAAHEEENR